MKSIKSATLLALALAATSFVRAEDKADIKIEFPEPAFAGTPVPAGGIKNLEKPGAPVKTFAAAKGATIVSKGKTVTASDSAPSIGDLAQIVDGDKEGADGSFVEFAPGPQSVTVDLGGRFFSCAAVPPG